MSSTSGSDVENDDPIPKKKPRLFRERINFDLIDADFRERFRFTREGVEELLRVLGPHLKPNSERNYAVSASHRLLVALRFFATGDYFYSNGDSHGGLSKATVCRIVHQVVPLINRLLLPSSIRWPDGEQNCRSIATRFYRFGGIPSVCGCVDGTLIKIIAPTINEEHYVDRKGT